MPKFEKITEEQDNGKALSKNLISNEPVDLLSDLLGEDSKAESKASTGDNVKPIDILEEIFGEKNDIAQVPKNANKEESINHSSAVEANSGVTLPLDANKIYDSSSLNVYASLLSANSGLAHLDLYFKDSILIENKNLSKNLHKSNELINQLKEIERTLQSKVESLNKQIHLSQSNEKRLMESSKAVSLKIMDLTSELGKTKKVVESLQGERAKHIEQDTRLESNIHSLQSQNSALKLQLSQAENKAKKLHKSLISNGGDNSIIAEELDNFRTIVYCSLCSKNWKNTAIKNCGHVFCEECCKERLAARMRKCPTCNKPFGSADLLVVHL